MKQLGRLEKVDLRDIWAGEATDFTPWLARTENLEVLADALGLELELEAQEKNVGPFRADLLCKDVSSDEWVLVENQLARTDHTHLGQLLTYASGLQAVTIVWIASRFTEEHRAALDWLNDITDSKFRFFGLEIELWRIDSSEPAPRFNITSKPNDWSRQVGSAARQINDGEMSETKALQLRFWESFNSLVEDQNLPIRTKSPRPRHWTTFPVGRSGFHFTATANTQGNRAGIELYIAGDDAKQYFALLREEAAEIGQEIDEALEWQELPNRIGSRIVVFREDSDISHEADWPLIHEWMAGLLVKFDNAFRNRIRNLDLATIKPGVDDSI